MIKATSQEKEIIHFVTNHINEKSINMTDVQYRRLLGRVLRKLYALRNISYYKEKTGTDFTSANNPKSLARVGISRKLIKSKP